jgi:hypothetical protein
LQYQLQQNQAVEIPVFAKDYYSRHSVLIEPEKTYLITCKPRQYWWDWFVPSSPQGYKNFIVKLFGLKLRVSSAKCFCICGVYGENETTAFKIGNQILIKPQKETKSLYFFANDYEKAYWNNWGKITIIIRRI